MSTQTPLPGLIEAMAGAVIDAQERIEKRQLAYLGEYFDEHNRPKSIVIRMPSMRPGATEDDEDLYRAPLLPLVSTSFLRVKDVEISFDADLGNLVEPAPDDTPGDGPMKKARPWGRRGESNAPVVQVDTSMKAGKGKSGAVHVVLRVEGAEPTEGAARLMNHLAQTQGVFRTFRHDDD
ncbi:DUF2589 domain-containing protein [Luteibacter yeojuensis]|uniref:DUF2589 domain-containing protein n=1 Tax=Luteibacter yeojuensis TaxID=345309 RepID=A0A7X5QVC7_9GAMM|nr:DUF2589 domain-containing protein [Luteibacter yeojuensis]NID16101.1 DUF2589 domain-containing protein [Luteibacter yeojuensis]